MARSDFDFESRMVPLLVWFAGERGLPVAPLLERFKLPADLPSQPPGKQYVTTKVSVLPALAEHVAQALGDAHVGLSLADAVPRGAYGVAEFLIRAGPTVRQSFEGMARFNAILSPNQTFRFDEVDDEAQLHHHATLQSGALGRHLNEFSGAIMVKALREMADVPVTRVWFTHARTPELDLARLTAAFSTARFEFGAATNGFAITRAALALPVKGSDPALLAFLEEHAVAALASRPKADDLLDKLRHQLREALKQGEPNVERVASRLNMSGRTLQRRLADLKSSFQDVLDQVRFDLARAYLKDARLDVSQVAYLLGYSELRAFDRAFRRWADQSPTEWRAAAQ